MIPLQYLGVHDVDQAQIPDSQLANYGLANLWSQGREGGYAVQHDWNALSEFPSATQASIWELTYPDLYPFGYGGPENPRRRKLSLTEYAQWALQYEDRRFRLHSLFPFHMFAVQQKREALFSARLEMRARDFHNNAQVLSTITIDQLRQAATDEEAHSNRNNDAVQLLKRKLYGSAARITGSNASRQKIRRQIWSTTIALGAPSVWLTINPDDLHSPITQVLCGADINLDSFDRTLGPDAHSRAINVARDPFAAGQSFDFVIEAILKHLIGVTVNTPGRVVTRKGILGHTIAYVGVVESQGRGSSHIHLLFWNDDTPSADDMIQLLDTEDFRRHVAVYGDAIMRARIEGLDTVEEVQSTPTQPEVAYSRQLDPDSGDYREQSAALALTVMRTKQVHVCDSDVCMIFKDGESRCKRGAPWHVSEVSRVEPTGEWYPQRLYKYFNASVPAISEAIMSNNDINLLTNGANTRQLSYYVTMYQTKKQGKSHNQAAILARGLAYHFERDSSYFTDLEERQRLLLFRAMNAFNREQEIAAPLVMAYLMGWGDSYCSHRYAAVRWSAFRGFAQARITSARLDQRAFRAHDDGEVRMKIKPKKALLNKGFSTGN